MGSSKQRAVVAAMLGAALVGAASPSRAELVRVDIASRVTVLNGRTFGRVGAYEKLWGRAHFAIDPAHPRNQVIADIALAPRNAAGKVEFSADVFILKPTDPARGNGVVFFDVVNRGRFRLLTTFSNAAAVDDPTEAATSATRPFWSRATRW